MAPFVRPKRSNSNLWASTESGGGRSPILPSAPSFATTSSSSGTGAGTGNPGGAAGAGVGSSSSNSPSTKLAPILEFLARTRRRPVRLLSTVAGILLALWLIIIFLGGLDPDLHIGPHIDPFTFQVLPPGDPRKRAAASSSINKFKKADEFWQFQQDWNTPDPPLLTNTPPSQRRCDKAGPLLFIGLFSTAQSAGRRQIIRSLFKPDLAAAGHTIAFRFIVARPPDDDWRYELEKENELYDDIAILEDVAKDNIDEGKSIEYFKWLARELPEPKPQFVMKMDDDTFLVMPNVIRNFASLDCTKSIYWGTTQGANSEMFGLYMRGLCYGLSWPLASWIGEANVTKEFAKGVEDAKIGRIISFLDPKTEPVEWIDWGWKMGDWDQMKVDETTVGFHWLKLDHWVPMVKRKALKAWEDAGRPYRWDWDRTSHEGTP